MQLTAKGRYGIRAVVDLALHSQSGPVSVHSICQRQEISEYYLQQLFRKLRKAGIIASVRGAAGGFLLAKRPEEIEVCSVILALGEAITPTPCGDDCLLYFLWQKLEEKIRDVLCNTTVADLCQEIVRSGRGKKRAGRKSSS